MDVISFFRKDFKNIKEVIEYVESAFDCEIFSVNKGDSFFNVELNISGLK